MTRTFAVAELASFLASILASVVFRELEVATAVVIVCGPAVAGAMAGHDLLLVRVVLTAGASNMVWIIHNMNFDECICCGYWCLHPQIVQRSFCRVKPIMLLPLVSRTDHASSAEKYWNGDFRAK